jgi:Coenzyme PQQ synthesis protein D (PqqD)
MSSEERYCIATPDVLHQAIDGEVILIHRSRGTYHSVRGSGELLFGSLLRGASARELAAVLAAQTDADEPTIEAAVMRFIQALWRDGLVVVATDAVPGDAEVAPLGTGLAKRPFEEPCLETFTDLQDLLTADPVHEVEPLGWPNVARPSGP